MKPHVGAELLEAKPEPRSLLHRILKGWGRGLRSGPGLGGGGGGFFPSYIALQGSLGFRGWDCIEIVSFVNAKTELQVTRVAQRDDMHH